jgi:hypothetical protein
MGSRNNEQCSGRRRGLFYIPSRTCIHRESAFPCLPTDSSACQGNPDAKESSISAIPMELEIPSMQRRVRETVQSPGWSLVRLVDGKSAFWSSELPKKNVLVPDASGDLVCATENGARTSASSQEDWKTRTPFRNTDCRKGSWTSPCLRLGVPLVQLASEWLEQREEVNQHVRERVRTQANADQLLCGFPRLRVPA